MILIFTKNIEAFTTKNQTIVLKVSPPVIPIALFTFQDITMCVDFIQDFF